MYLCTEKYMYYLRDILIQGGGLLRGLYSIFVVVIVAFVVDIDVIVVSSIFLALNKPLMHCHMLFDLVLRNFFFHLFPTWY